MYANLGIKITKSIGIYFPYLCKPSKNQAPY